MRAASALVDTALDRSVVLGFTRLGLGVRSHLPGWPADPAPQALLGRHVAVTGASSGLGAATALGLARLGAQLHLVVRNPEKARPVVARIVTEVPTAVVEVHRCDVGDLDDVRRFAASFESPLDVLVHNAGVMPPSRTESQQGHELAMAVHVLGPVLMSELLRPRERVVLVTSGGMYAQRLRADDPEYLTGRYSPTTAYARSKRAQVELLSILDRRWEASVWATHPGWADTPGVADSLPGFRRLTRPLLRDAEGGADTTVWLSAVDPAPPGGSLWHDRRRRPPHFSPTTRSRPGDVARMWRWVCEQIGIEETSPDKGGAER
ncbi:SDR family NAD(P)-dependent oxidoreductase [Nocardioides mangrovicus]|uniref:SDR family NAD(P)-dependent oxidoreductase n=1 Tax=Nocardioides mangrovicus TaxID=2478913 RepID=A0A3L8NZP6_9ACTN|nr:SDR family NAD(P)-dependent oxidoreductase [Nocardioides mangrovicus]RLV48132.1 SDR family NAD(P)-dependent oxidoreductase [Nocardioides mangrovicus]